MTAFRPPAPGPAAPRRQHPRLAGTAAVPGGGASSRSWPASTSLVLAPTAGGKTEAAFFPVLSRMLTEDWRRARRPLRLPDQGPAEQPGRPAGALLRTAGPAVGLLARRRRRRGRRRRSSRDPPDCLLTTPESLEVMLVSGSDRPRAALRGRCGRSSSTRSTPSPATTGAGTCWPSSPASAGWRAGTSSGSACRRRSATRTSCWTGCPAGATGRGGSVTRPGARPRRTPDVQARLRRLAAATPPRSSPACTGARSGWSSCDSRSRVEQLALRAAGPGGRRRSSRTARWARTSGARPRRRSPAGTTASSWPPAHWSWASTSATSTASSRSTPRRRSRASSSGWAAPGGGRARRGTACSWPRTTTRCCGPPG